MLQDACQIKVEPYWNVKIINDTELTEKQIIKVEPYWNVKEVAFVHALDTEAIKVEPYWNVKNRQSNTGGDTGN